MLTASHLCFSVMDHLRRGYQFELTLLEMVFLKRICTEIVEMNQSILSIESLDYIWSFPEALWRFLGEYYQVDIVGFLHGPFSRVANPRELIELIRDRYRPEEEGIEPASELIRREIQH